MKLTISPPFSSGFHELKARRKCDYSRYSEGSEVSYEVLNSALGSKKIHQPETNLIKNKEVKHYQLRQKEIFFKLSPHIKVQEDFSYVPHRKESHLNHLVVPLQAFKTHYKKGRVVISHEGTSQINFQI